MSLEDYDVDEKLQDGDNWKCTCKCKTDDKMYFVKKMSKSQQTSQLCEKLKRMKHQLQHRNIVQLKEAFADTTDKAIYFVMEHCEGGDLKTKKEAGEHMTEEHLVNWLIDVCFGLEHLHSRQLVLPRLTTADILLTSERVAKINIFGIDSVSGSGGTSSGNAAAAPDQANMVVDQRKSFEADVKSLGSCAFDMMGLIPENNNLAELQELVGLLMQNGTLKVIASDILQKPFIKKRIFENFTKCMSDYCDRLDESSTSIRHVATDLTKLHRKLLKARIGAGAIGVVGGTLGIAAGIATIVTAGMLAPVVIGVVAGSTAAAASLTGLAAQLVSKFKDKEHVKRAKAELKEVKTKATDLRELIASILMIDADKRPKLEDTRRTLEEKLTIKYRPKKHGRANMAGVVGRTAGAGAATAKCAANIAGRGAARIAAGAGKVAGSFGIAFGAVGVGLDIWQIVDAGIDFREDNPEASRGLIAIADSIDERSMHIRSLYGLVKKETGKL